MHSAMQNFILWGEFCQGLFIPFIQNWIFFDEFLPELFHTIIQNWMLFDKFLTGLIHTYLFKIGYSSMSFCQDLFIPWYSKLDTLWSFCHC